MNITALRTPEEYALLLEPFPFITDEAKSELVESSKIFFDFQSFMMEKHNTTADIIQARLDIALNAKLAKKITELDNREDLKDIEDNDITIIVLGEVFDEICVEEGFAVSLKDYIKKIIGIQVELEKHVAQLISEGREEELNNFIKLMDNGNQ